MRFIPTLFHGIADYTVGVLVLALPYLLGLDGSPRALLIILGLAVIIYSLMTDYELGVVRFLRIRFHLFLDAIFGVVMLLAPWALSFPDQTRWPVYLIGTLALVLVTTTEIRAVGSAEAAKK